LKGSTIGREELPIIHTYHQNINELSKINFSKFLLKDLDFMNLNISEKFKGKLVRIDEKFYK
jgi:hypothetical protein